METSRWPVDPDWVEDAPAETLATLKWLALKIKQTFPSRLLKTNEIGNGGVDEEAETVVGEQCVRGKYIHESILA